MCVCQHHYIFFCRRLYRYIHVVHVIPQRRTARDQPTLGVGEARRLAKAEPVAYIVAGAALCLELAAGLGGTGRAGVGRK